MKFRQLSETKDFTFGRGKQNYCDNLQALMLNLETRIKSWVGDCFFAMNFGIDWKNLMDYNRKKELIQAIQMIALKTEGVIGIRDLQVNIGSDRTAVISFTVDTVFGNNTGGSITVSV